MHNRKMRFGAGTLLAGGIIAIAASSGGCSAASTLVEAAKGCDEFSGGADSVATLSVDGDTKAFLTASTNLVKVATDIETSVMGACIKIDTDLGVTDTWTAMAPAAGDAPDAELTEVGAGRLSLGRGLSTRGDAVRAVLQSDRPVAVEGESHQISTEGRQVVVTGDDSPLTLTFS